MNPNFKSNERELIKLATFFKKQSQTLIEQGKLGEEHRKVEEVVDRFIDQIELHANTRATLTEQHEYLAKLIKDDAQCPTCKSAEMLKFVSVDTNDKGWKSNRYKCRKCNIEFTWNRPNNPWDMISYIEEVLQTFRTKQALSADPLEKEQFRIAIDGMQASLDSLKPVIMDHDQQYNVLMAREAEMEKLIHEFKNSLMIEKIRMDTWENRN